MKKLNLPTLPALTPICTNDLKFLQNGITEAFDCILKALGLENDDFVISGCKITDSGSKLSMSPGWCYYDGEIFPVRALQPTSYSGSTPKIKFTKVINYDPTGDRDVVLSGVTGSAQVYQDNYLQPSLVTSQEQYRLAISKGAWDLGERIVNMGKPVDSGVISPNDVFGSGIRYRMIGGIVQIYGMLKQDAVGAGWQTVVATGLPRPAVTVHLPNNYGYIEVRSDGSLFVRSKEDNVYLNHVVYLATPVYNTADGHYSNINQSQQGGSVA